MADQMLICLYYVKRSNGKQDGLGDWSWEDLAPNWVIDAVRIGTAPLQWLINHGGSWLTDNILGPVLRKIFGNSLGNKIVAVIGALMDAPGAAIGYIVWLMGISVDLIMVIVQGIRSADFGYVMKEIGTMLSRALLRAPGISDLLVIMAAAGGGTRQQVNAQLDRMARKDPAFGINIIMFAIGLFPWPATALKLGNPATAGPIIAQFLGVLRKVIIALVQEELHLNASQVQVVDKVYALVLLAVMQVQSFSSSLETLGVGRDKAVALWNRLYRALTTFSFGTVISSFGAIIGALGEAQRTGLAPTGAMVQSIQSQLTAAVEARARAEVRKAQVIEQRDIAVRSRDDTERQLRALQRTATASSTENRSLAARLATEQRMSSTTVSEWQIIAGKQRKIAIAGVATAGVLALLLAAGA